jgi:hypothetical protein
LDLEGAKGPSSFYLGHFFSSKSFDHIVKDVSVFHLKLSNNHRLGYFPTSTLQDTLPITTADLLQAIGL